MKRMYNFFMGVVAIVAMSFLVSCEGPAGPAGADGIDGQNGADGDLACLACHTNANMDAINAEYAQSTHNLSNVMYTGQTVYQYASIGAGREECSGCHSNEGFIFRVKTGSIDGLPTLDAASKVSCETCHGSHTNFDGTIEAPIRTQDPIVSVIDGSIMDFGGNSNLCGTCHQARTPYTGFPIVDTLMDGSAAPAGTYYYMNSSHGGPHHGPQANVIFANIGSVPGAAMAHKNAGCTSCHMGEAEGTTEGGHTFFPNATNCATCHDDVDAATFDRNGFIAGFDTDMAAIAEALVTEGILSGNATDGYSPKVGIFPEKVYLAWWNYMVLSEDKSHGIHNPAYANTLIGIAKGNLGL